MLVYLNDIFSTILILILFAITTLNILDYIMVLFKIFGPLQIYWQFFNHPSFGYIIKLINIKSFADFAFQIYNSSPIAKIPKILIFINKINKTIELEKQNSLSAY